MWSNALDNKYNIEIKNKLNSYHSNIISNIAKVMNELNLNNIHKDFYLFCYLLWNGYFSIDKEYYYNDADIVDEDNTIFLGRGCCRHNAKLLEKVFKKLGYFCRENKIEAYKMEPYEVDGIKLKVEKQEYNSSSFSRNYYNHSIILVTNMGSIYLLDPTIVSECEVLNKANLICFNGSYKVNRNLLSKDLKIFLPNVSSYNEKPIISCDEIDSLYSSTFGICLDNKNLFDDFYIENRDNYQNIKSLILK